MGHTGKSIFFRPFYMGRVSVVCVWGYFMRRQSNNLSLAIQSVVTVGFENSCGKLVYLQRASQPAVCVSCAVCCCARCV